MYKSYEMSNCLKKIRESRGLTQKELGKLIHKTDVTVSRYESEDQRLTLPLMRQLSETLDCTVSQIAGESDLQIGDVLDFERFDALLKRVLEINAKLAVKKKSMMPSQISQLVLLYYKSDITINDDEMERSAELLVNTTP